MVVVVLALVIAVLLGLIGYLTHIIRWYQDMEYK